MTPVGDENDAQVQAKMNAFKDFAVYAGVVRALVSVLANLVLGSSNWNLQDLPVQGDPMHWLLTKIFRVLRNPESNAHGEGLLPTLYHYLDILQVNNDGNILQVDNGVDSVPLRQYLTHFLASHPEVRDVVSLQSVKQEMKSAFVRHVKNIPLRVFSAAKAVLNNNMRHHNWGDQVTADDKRKAIKAVAYRVKVLIFHIPDPPPVNFPQNVPEGTRALLLELANGLHEQWTNHESFPAHLPDFTEGYELSGRHYKRAFLLLKVLSQILENMEGLELEARAAWHQQEEGAQPPLFWKLPKGFSITPSYKLRCAQVRYNPTELSHLNHVLRPAFPRQDHGLLHQAGEYTRLWLEYLPGAREMLKGLRYKTDEVRHVQNGPIHRRNYVTGFRSDGFTLSVNLAGNISKPFNTAELLRPKYNFLRTIAPPINLWKEVDGVHVLRQQQPFSFHPMLPPSFPEEAFNYPMIVRVTGLDPGLFQVYKCSTWEGTLGAFRHRFHGGTPQTILQGLTQGEFVQRSASENRWLNQSGLNSWNLFESTRRVDDVLTPYGLAVNAMSGTDEEPASRHACGIKYENYAKALVRHICTIMTEMTDPLRRTRAWARQRKYASFIRKTANKIAGRTSPQPRPNHILNFVFFGDAWWADVRRHVKLPKKRLIRELKNLCVVLMTDEYRTSKRCPCGQPLEVDPDDDRHQRHQDQFLDQFCQFLSWSRDRDDLASVNILSIGICKLLGLPWPAALRR